MKSSGASCASDSNPVTVVHLRKNIVPPLDLFEPFLVHLGTGEFLVDPGKAEQVLLHALARVIGAGLRMENKGPIASPGQRLALYSPYGDQRRLRAQAREGAPAPLYQDLRGTRQFQGGRGMAQRDRAAGQYFSGGELPLLGLSHWDKSINCFSSMIFTPSFLALFRLEPASPPPPTESVFLLTLLLTFPPAASILAVASSRVKLGRVPVRTKVCPASGPALALGWYSSEVKFTPALRRRSIKFRFRPSPCHCTMLWAMTSPMSSHWVNRSTEAANTSSSVAKPRPSALATPAPTCKIPSP